MSRSIHPVVAIPLHQRGDAANHNAGSEILQAVIHAITEKTFEEIGQQLLLLAFTPAIHNTCYQVCQKFPALSQEDVAQQASLVFLETARSPETLRQNGHIQIALARRFRPEPGSVGDSRKAVIPLLCKRLPYSIRSQ